MGKCGRVCIGQRLPFSLVSDPVSVWRFIQPPPFPLTQTSFEALFDDHSKKSPLSEMCFCLLKNRRETIFSKTIFEIQIIPSFLFKEKDVQ